MSACDKSSKKSAVFLWICTSLVVVVVVMVIVVVIRGRGNGDSGIGRGNGIGGHCNAGIALLFTAIARSQSSPPPAAPRRTPSCG